MSIRFADAEVAKLSGGMVALYPRLADAQKLVVPGGEPLEDLHMTVTYLGEDVTGQDPTELIDQLHYVAGNFGPIDAKIFGAGVFNSTSPDACVVYLVGGSPDITGLFRELKGFVEHRYPGAAEQHDPYIPHITAAYGPNIVGVEYEGPVLFDRIGLRWPGADQDFIL
jgi:2'-5' RNA ligase